MSIIAVHGFSQKYSLMDVVKLLARPIYGNFEALNFITPPGQGLPKNKALRTCYIRLSETLDPVRIVQQINDFKFRTKKQFKAHIPRKVPDIPLSAKPKRMPLNVRLALKIPDDTPLDQLQMICTEELVLELEIKYPGLYPLSKKYDHALLRDLSKTIYKRVQDVSEQSKKDTDLCIKLTRAYRNFYPHTGDFQLILDLHHAIEDAAGVPRAKIEEADISSVALPPKMFDIPLKRLRHLRNICADRILAKMTEHIKGLDAEINPRDTEEEIARKQVRGELKKLTPFLSPMVHQMLDRNFMPQEGPLHRMRIYGEPFIPDKDVLTPFLSRFNAVKLRKSLRMYNLVMFSVQPAFYHSLMSMHGTVLNGAKLTIRTSDVAQYKGVKNAILGIDVNEEEDEEIEEGPMDVVEGDEQDDDFDEDIEFED